MKKSIEHIKHIRNNSKDCSFYICNIFRIENGKIEFNDIFKFDLLNEKYFNTEKKLKEMGESWKSFIQNERKETEPKSEIIESYGPIIKSKINSNDFEKLNYEEYELKMKSIFQSWRKSGDGFEDELEKFHVKSINDLQNFNLEKRDYYFLNYMLIHDNKKHELNFIYSYFFKVIGIDYESNTFIKLNYGNE
ncbi:hypothetical protein [Tenacibaculum sp. SG-28]|uniref:hypothetical protein n=1 Tax=Tenacibaculum sp. SG-28 TaxID=754426 RepID=UPI000CF471F5|nr:hypothetical protein [Tenacibaculum sp. SG-28]PQJ20602.1 hypothetical protein BSU00_09825 [Tenacibaculum sp. SG-28]